MASRTREPPRLNINVPQYQQQGPPAMFSPAIQTGVGHSFHPPIPQSAVSSFFPNGPGMPMPMHPHQGHHQGHPSLHMHGGPPPPQMMMPPHGGMRPGHRVNQASMHLAAAGIHPPPPGLQGPGTPGAMGGHFPRQSISGALGGTPPTGGGGHPHPFPGRSRRQPSIGGPPKAVLGGPARKVSPLPGAPASTAPTTAPVTATGAAGAKKRVVNFPKETDEAGERKEWARYPLPHPEHELEVEWPREISSGVEYPSEEERHEMPPNIDVFLPRQQTWDLLKQQIIEEKLEKLGVGSGSNIPNIHAPHARAASISSPADPGLLLFKLNKLQQAQSLSASNPNSLQSSPQPLFLTPSPRMFNGSGHGHSMSLAHLPPTRSPVSNPFGPDAVLGFDQKAESIAEEEEEGGEIDENGDADTDADADTEEDADEVEQSNPNNTQIFAPVGRIPLDVKGLSAVQPPVATAMDKFDFARGFGLDTAEGEEEEEGTAADLQDEVAVNAEIDREIDAARIERTPLPDIIQEVDEEDEEMDAGSEEDYGDENKENEQPPFDAEEDRLTAQHSKHHSRHESRLSAALSFRSFGGLIEEGLRERGDEGLRTHRLEGEDAMEEWTGTEDVYGGDSSEDESIGEWSNPSDEERARQQRAERRLRRRRHVDEQPRRLPDFPRPPEGTRVFHTSHRHQQEDDIISNPSEEEQLRSHYYHNSNSGGAETLNGRSPRPLPAVPIPHSRATSGQHSIYDPARAHSRHPSSQQLQDAMPLNPHAKPFTFGSSKLNVYSAPFVPSFVTSSAAVTGLPEPMPSLQVAAHSTQHSGSSSQASGHGLGHGRSMSFGKPLNAAAQEFKPGGFAFTFSAPSAPAFPSSAHLDVGRPLPLPPIESSPFRVPMQGREKRQRREDDEGEESVVEEGDTMDSFRFPPGDMSTPPKAKQEAGGSTGSFTFATFSAASTLPQIPKTEAQAEAIHEGAVAGGSTFKANETTANGELGNSARLADFEFPSPVKSKRAPIPLDFKHPVSSNTVPAGLFKALQMNGGNTSTSSHSHRNSADERTRRSVRSRLSSHDVFEQVRRPSLDDLDVPGISLAHKVSRTRLVTDPGPASVKRSSRHQSPTDDVFGKIQMTAKKHARRRSSLPDEKLGLSSSASSGSSMSEVSSIGGAENLTTRLEMHHLERTLDRVLDEKMEKIKMVGQRLSPEAEAMIAEVVALFRSQLQESAARGLDDSQMDARGEIDFELFKGVMEQGHARIFDLVKTQLEAALPRMTEVGLSSANRAMPDMERYSQRILHAIAEVIQESSARLESIALAQPRRERDAITEGVVSAVAPLFAQLQQPPVNYDRLTDQLADAVKPHISQLIDLASDKRETAAIIVEQLIPLVPSLQKEIDTDAISHKLSAEVRRAIGPIDAFEIKEGVADLVVERLDSRLAVRDKQLNIVDALGSKVADGLAGLREPVEAINARLESMVDAHKSFTAQQADIVAANKELSILVADVPTGILASIDSLKATQEEIASRQPESNPLPDANILHIKSAVDDLVASHHILDDGNGKVYSRQEDILRKLEELPETFNSAIAVLQDAHAEFALKGDSVKNEMDDLRKSNTDYQVQLAKARGAHGQVRVEKDTLAEKLSLVDADRDRMRAQIKELQTAASVKDARNAELEEALSKALARLQASDVSVQANMDKIGELEVANRELQSDRQMLKSKVDSLDLQVAFASRDKEAAEKALAAIHKQYDQLTAQQEHWENLRHTSEQIDKLTALIGRTDKQELQELRGVRDRSKILEGEHSALQKRVKELETHQKETAEWMKRAQELEDALEVSKMRADESDKTRSELENDNASLRSQIEERDTEERAAKDRETRLRDNVAALELKVQRLQGELEKAVVQRGAAAAATRLATTTRQMNGGGYVETPTRSISRATTHRRDSSTSTVNGRDTPPAKTPSRAPVFSQPTPQSQGFKAPRPHYIPTQRYNYNSYNSSRAASPAASVVSTVPTVDDEGWYS